METEQQQKVGVKEAHDSFTCLGRYCMLGMHAITALAPCVILAFFNQGTPLIDTIRRAGLPSRALAGSV